MDRRAFLKNASAALALAALPIEVDALTRSGKKAGPGFTLQKGDVILFTGDSITDGFREKKYYRLANHIRALGNGYVQLTASRLNYMFPEKEMRIYNTGVNGDTITKLLDRLDIDCIKLKPSVISILIGVNDFNVSFTASGKGDPERYEREYRELLNRLRNALPNVRFIIGEPYALKGAREKIDAWYPEFETYQHIARQIARDFDAVFIPYQTIYTQAMSNAPTRYFSTDGVHPSLAGVRLMCDNWISHVNPK